MLGVEDRRNRNTLRIDWEVLTWQNPSPKVWQFKFNILKILEILSSPGLYDRQNENPITDEQIEKDFQRITLYKPS